MLVVSEKYRVVYPKNFDDQADMSQIYSAFLNAATDDESFWEQDKILEETIEEKEYLLYYKYVTPSEREKDQKVRHILLYCPVHDTTAMDGSDHPGGASDHERHRRRCHRLILAGGRQYFRTGPAAL